MKRRHVKVIAVCAIVLVTLTGARRGGGDGGCDDDNDSNSSSVTSGGSIGGSDDDFDIPDPSFPTSGTTTSGGTTSPTLGSGENDARVLTCDYDQTSQNFTADVQITNSAPTSQDYSIIVSVKETSPEPGKLLGSDLLRVDAVGPGQVQTVKAESFRPLTEASTFECSISKISRSTAI